MKVRTSLLVFLALLSLLHGPARGEPLFEPLETSAVSVDGGLSRGVTWGDMDGDGDPDLAVGNSIGQLDFLYRNEGNGRFTQLHEIPFTLNNGWTEGIGWVDFDNDGDLDLFVASGKPNYLYANDGLGNLTPFDAGELTTGQFDVSEGCWADYDNDGYLDVFLANRAEQDDVLFRNVRGLTFERVPGPFDGHGGDARTCAWGDADGDGDLDLYVGNFIDRTGSEGPQKARNFLYLNGGDGTFSEVTEHLLVESREQTYGASWVDFDNDGDHDLFVTNIGRADRNLLYENHGNLRFVSRRDLTISYDSMGPSKGHAWGDFDNDGDLDLFVTNGTETPDNRNFLYLHDGQGIFSRIAPEAIVEDNFTSAGAAWADFDGDGDLDLFTANWGESDEDNRLYRNRTMGKNWLKVRLEGTKSNRFGIGAFARLGYPVEAEEKVQTRVLLPKTGYGSSNEPILHFGLGSGERITFLEIAWPSGLVQRFEGLHANQFLLITEGQRRPVQLTGGGRSEEGVKKREPVLTSAPQWRRGVLALAAVVAIFAIPASAQETLNLSIFADAYPCWSPDGAQLVFHSTRMSAEDQVFIMNADGGGVRQLTFTEAANRTAVFSPDGRKIAFQSERDGNREIYVMNADGSEQTRLTFDEGEDSHPKWSANGRQIIFDSVRANPDLGYENLYIMNADGSGLERVTERVEVDSYSSLSPDGSKVLFRRILPSGGNTQSGRNSEVFIMNRDGSNAINLSNHPGFDGYPSWSPDGRYVLFASNREGESFDEFNLYVMRPDGSGLRKLTQTIPGVSQVRQMVSADGERIVFNRDFPDGRVEIHVMPFDPE